MLGRTVSTVATGVTITIELPARVTLRSVLGRAYRQTGNRIEIDFHDLGGGASKYSLLELTIPRGDEGQVLDALVARARYRRVADNREGETSARTQVRYTSRPAEADASVNLEVQNAWVELHQAAVQDEVLDLVERGERQQAQQRLRKLGEESEPAWRDGRGEPAAGLRGDLRGAAGHAGRVVREPAGSLEGPEGELPWDVSELEIEQVERNVLEEQLTRNQDLLDQSRLDRDPGFRPNRVPVDAPKHLHDFLQQREAEIPRPGGGAVFTLSLNRSGS